MVEFTSEPSETEELGGKVGKVLIFVEPVMILLLLFVILVIGTHCLISFYPDWLDYLFINFIDL